MSLLVLVLALLAWGTSAHAQTELNRRAKPIVLLLLDTSGSMEYLSEAGSFPCCHSPGVAENASLDPIDPSMEASTPLDPAVTYCQNPPANPALTWEKPRHITAKEVLTGRYEDYYCENVSRIGAPSFDDAYLFPHFEPRYSEQVIDTGLVHINRDLVRFGFMAFDSDKTGGVGDTFSYPKPDGENGESAQWNLGVRGPDASVSPMVEVGDLGNPALGPIKAEEVADSIRSFIPYEATPLAAMIKDINYYLTDHGTGSDIHDDDFQACRPIEIVLITDGDPSFDDCALGQPRYGLPECQSSGVNYPYGTTLEELSKLMTDHSNVKVHVVGFELTDSQPCRVGSVAGVVNGSCIDQLAMVGNTDANATGNASDPTRSDNIYAHRANNQVDLTRKLTRILNNIVGGISARTRTTSTSRTNDPRRAGLYQFSGAFEIDDESHLWRGLLERRTYSCLGGTPQVSTVTEFGDILDDNLSRTIYTPFYDPAQAGGDLEDAFIESGSGANARRLLQINEAASTLTGISGLNQAKLDAAFRAGVLNNADGTPVDFEYIIDLLEGKNERTGRALGDIFHSNPIISGGPELSLDILGYRRFSAYARDRATTLFVGSNAGLLHAFSADTGGELWSYLPMELQDQIYLQKATRIFGVDASPLVRDLRLYRGSALPAGFRDPVPTGADLPEGALTDVWGTVIVGGLRAGGRAYYALDVSSPSDPRFLWELNPTTEQHRLNEGNLDEFLVSADTKSENTDDAPLLGLSYGQPALGTVLLNNGDSRDERGVAILSGGLPSSVNAVDEGKAVYVVEVATGKILRRFTQFSNGDYIDAPVTGDVGAFNDFPGELITRAFVGDAKGRLLRIDMRNSDPTLWTIDVFHDSGSGTPIFIRPAMATNRRGEVVVIYGTGDVDNIERRGVTNSIVSLSEQISFAGDGTVSSIGALVNWQLFFDSDEKLTGSPLIYNSTAYFPTFVPADAACSDGHGRVYAVDFDGDDNYGGDRNTATNDIIGRFNPNDNQFAADNNDVDLGLDSGNLFFDLPGGTVVFGLDIAQRPTCTPDIPENLNDPAFQQAISQATLQQQPLELVVQTGAGTAVPGGPGQGSRINALKFQLERPPSSIFPVSWSVVLD